MEVAAEAAGGNAGVLPCAPASHMQRAQVQLTARSPLHPHLPSQQMTYVKQLEQYEEAVMRKRVEEMTEEEMAELIK